jgi:hypothetical protein
MSGHNEAQTAFQQLLPEIIRGMLEDIAGFARNETQDRSYGRQAVRGHPDFRVLEDAFITSMEALYAHIGRQLQTQPKPLAEMSEPELDQLAQTLAASLRGG